MDIVRIAAKRDREEERGERKRERAICEILSFLLDKRFVYLTTNVTVLLLTEWLDDNGFSYSSISTAVAINLLPPPSIYLWKWKILTFSTRVRFTTHKSLFFRCVRFLITSVFAKFVCRSVMIEILSLPTMRLDDNAWNLFFFLFYCIKSRLLRIMYKFRLTTAIWWINHTFQSVILLRI